MDLLLHKLVPGGNGDPCSRGAVKDLDVVLVVEQEGHVVVGTVCDCSLETPVEVGGLEEQQVQRLDHVLELGLRNAPDLEVVVGHGVQFQRSQIDDDC